MALYGHPDSGTMWEEHCDRHVKKGRFRRSRAVVAVVLFPQEIESVLGRVHELAKKVGVFSEAVLESKKRPELMRKVYSILVVNTVRSP